MIVASTATHRKQFKFHTVKFDFRPFLRGLFSFYPFRYCRLIAVISIKITASMFNVVEAILASDLPVNNLSSFIILRKAAAKPITVCKAAANDIEKIGEDLEQKSRNAPILIQDVDKFSSCWNAPTTRNALLDKAFSGILFERSLASVRFLTLISLLNLSKAKPPSQTGPLL